ncbi:FAD-dependent thymidylate synthase [Helicobacter aurati]|uniref:Flavin-dependent thymidylate synthase n=1 Tax=Helicobacter aurati TaxID=137778 RepID=A0A3D8J6F3_9HELI|nr:FAD-dependent thymidylate synthase [Helicobacter aurati]RDU72696.1 FAD-dependent thymidylate synthase [Helicobacter aurati]
MESASSPAYNLSFSIKLLHYTPLNVCVGGVRTCWDSFDKASNKADLELIDRVGNKFKHKSVLEHLSYSFEIKGISRACLIELTRHRMASYSVKSTRYTLKELRQQDSFLPIDSVNFERASKWVVFTQDNETNNAIIHSLEKLRELLVNGKANDVAKYALPEAYRTNLYFTINARSLQNFFELRTDKRALFEIRKLALAIYSNLPHSHKYLFKGSVKFD